MEKKELTEKLKKVKLVALDFDGVLTDGFVYFRQDGMETVRCSRRDSLGINMIQKAGVGVVVISKETNPVVEARCKKMGVPCFHGADTATDKLSILKQYITEKNVSAEEVLYMGDDVNDFEALCFAGFAVTVADGAPEVKEVAHYVTSRNGGDHAVREVCDLILGTK